MGQELCILRL